MTRNTVRRYSPEVRARAGLTAPDDTATLGSVGLSRREAMAALVPGPSAAERDRLVERFEALDPVLATLVEGA